MSITQKAWMNFIALWNGLRGLGLMLLAKVQLKDSRLFVSWPRGIAMEIQEGNAKQSAMLQPSSVPVLESGKQKSAPASQRVHVQVVDSEMLKTRFITFAAKSSSNDTISKVTSVIQDLESKKFGRQMDFIPNEYAVM